MITEFGDGVVSKVTWIKSTIGTHKGFWAYHYDYGTSRKRKKDLRGCALMIHHTPKSKLSPKKDKVTLHRSTLYSQTRPATAKQKYLLQELGITFTNKLTVAQASELITNAT